MSNRGTGRPPKTSKGTFTKFYSTRRRQSASSPVIPPVQSTFTQSQSSPGTIQGWTFLLESGQAYDQNRLDSWKDELNNLLVFAGLFSAVVTAFVIESYTSLQADTATISNQLLSQISLQLSSFALSSNFANSTAPLPSPGPISAPFSPDDADVTVNLLWFLSLTFSLVAAFFAIAAQQWLRSLSLPRHLSIWNAVRLQQSHRRSMSFCQVPNIISLLPVLLQIAVILFLVGLWFFLDGLNERITIAYSVIALLPFVLYAVSLILPIFWPEMPFKSPLVPSAAFVLQWCMLLMFILAMVTVVLPCLMIARIGTGAFALCGKYYHLGYHIQHVRLRMFTLASRFELHLRNMYASLFKQTVDFWADREVKYLQRTDIPGIGDSDFGEALASAPHFVPRKDLKELHECYKSLPPAERIRCALVWTSTHLGYSGEEDISESGSWLLIDQKFVQKVNEYLGISFQKVLLEALPGDLGGQDWVREVPNITRVLILLNHLVKLDGPALGNKLVPLLVDICSTQDIIVKSTSWLTSEIRSVTIPTLCLFESSDCSHFAFDRAQTDRLLTLATKRATDYIKLQLFVELEYITVSMHDLVLGSFAVAFLALSQQPRDPWDEELMRLAGNALGAFAKYIEAKADGIRFAGQVASGSSKNRLTIAPRAMKAVATSLKSLSGMPWMQDHCPSLVEALRDVCHAEPAFKDAVNVLADGQRTPATTQQPRRRRRSMPPFQRSSPSGSVNGNSGGSGVDIEMAEGDYSPKQP